MKPVDSANVYTDFSGLDAIRGEGNNKAALKKVAKQFEAVFLQMAMKSMRDANKAFKSDLVDEQGSEVYQDLYDKQLTLSMSEGRNFGLADAIVRQLSAHVDSTKITTDSSSDS